MASILVVDDEVRVRTVFERALVRKGHAVCVAESAEAAAELVSAQHFDVVITDLVLPRMDGLGLAEMVRKQAPSTPILLLTGAPSKDSIELGESLGVTQLTKPILPSELLVKVAEVLERR